MRNREKSKRELQFDELVRELTYDVGAFHKTIADDALIAASEALFDVFNHASEAQRAFDIAAVEPEEYGIVKKYYIATNKPHWGSNKDFVLHPVRRELIVTVLRKIGFFRNSNPDQSATSRPAF